MFKSLLLALGLLQNQEQATLLPANKTQEVCLASDEWKYISSHQREKEALNFMVYCAVPASLVLSAAVFYKEHVETQAFMEDHCETQTFMKDHCDTQAFMEKVERRERQKVVENGIKRELKTLPVIEE